MAPPSTRPAEAADVAQVAASSIHFAIDLFSRIAATESGDVVVSPNSVMLALAMTFAGTGGDTAREMAEVLHFSIDPQRIHEAFRWLRESKLSNDVELRIANRLWGQMGYRFLPEFVSLTRRCYGARLAEMDFLNQPELARQQINEWIKQKTAERITDLVPPGAINSITRLVLTNAVYFLGGWESEFEEVDTKPAPFWTRPNEKQTVPMMHQAGDFRYGDFDDVQVLELPYRHRPAKIETIVLASEDGTPSKNFSDLVMTFILPRTIDGLKDIEADISPLTLNQWTTLRRHEVNLAIPRFRIESGFGLSEALESLGMPQAFSVEDADFSRMSDDPDGLFIGEVLHKAFVDVNEKGTEAAAATAAVMLTGYAAEQEPPKEFRADHPFLFLIRDRNTRLIHFMGRMSGCSLN